MAFKGVTFSGQNVTPKNDGGLYRAHYGDGILWGCSMAISGDDLVIQSGEFIACGRVCHVDGATNVDLSTRTLTNGYIQVVMDFDVSKSEGNQWNIHLPLIESATTTFPTLTTDDINDNGNLYQMQLAVVQVSGGNLTSITSSLGATSYPINSTSGTNGVLRAGSGSAIVLSANTGSMYFRPNGDSASSGQAILNTSGQFKATGSIYSDNPSSDPYYGLQSNGTNKGSLYYDISNSRLALNNSNGGSLSVYDAGQIYLNGSGGNLYLRPNGNSTGQAYLDTSGQFHGGCTVLGNSKSTPTNITAGTWAKLCTVTLPVGMFVISGTANFKGLGASSTNWAMVCIGHSSSATTSRNTIPLSGTTSTYLGASASLIIDNTTASYTIDLYANAEANTSVSTAELRAIQIG